MVTAGRLAVPVPAQCLQYVVNGDTVGIGATCLNPAIMDGTSAQVSFFSALDWTPKTTRPVNLLLNDFVLHFDSVLGSPIVIASGYRKDSAFICRVTPGNEPIEYLFVASGFDRTHSPWRGLREFIYSGDLDHDGQFETLFRMGSSRNPLQQVMVCVDSRSMSIRWQIPFPFFATQVVESQCGVHGLASLLIIGHSSRPEQPQPSYGDLYAHLIRISATGEILFNRVIGKTGDNTPLVFDEASHRAYVCHNLPLMINYDSADVREPQSRLTSFDCDDIIRASVALPALVYDLWMGKLEDDRPPYLFGIAPRSAIQVYDTLLDIVAESEEIPALGSFSGYLPHMLGYDSVLAFTTDRQVTLYNSSFDMLLSAPFAAQRVQGLCAAGGQRPIVLATSVNGYALILLEKRSLMESLTVMYLDYKAYILVGIVLLIGALFGAVFVWRKVRSQKSVIESAHEELALTHEELVGTHHALKAAQTQMIEQEKYRLAQDIAGSFAHEIRNALFPVDMSIAKIEDLFNQVPVDHARLEKLLGLSQLSISRALMLTDSISTYTKLESQYSPTPTRVASAIDDVLAANQQRIDQQSIQVTVEGDRQAHVIMRSEHLFMIVNNLVLNALDALTNRPSPSIAISWTTRSDQLELTCSDNGSGISEAESPRILEAFYSTKPSGGTGLGLAIVKRLVDLYGATISFTSRVNEGTTFTVSMRMGKQDSEQTYSHIRLI